MGANEIGRASPVFRRLLSGSATLWVMRNSVAPVLLLLALMAIFTGCSRTVTGGFEDSPDKKYRLYGRVYGALGKAFLDKTRKTVRLSVVTNNAVETVLFTREFRVTGSDVGLNWTWDKDANVTVAIFGYGPRVSEEDALKAGS